MILNSEQYVNFKTARLLKENGFDVPCKRLFFKDGTPGISKEETNHNGTTCSTYSRPTLILAVRWIRETYKVESYISSHFSWIGWMYHAELEDKIVINSSRPFATPEEAYEKCIQKVLKTIIRRKRKK